MLSLRPNVWSPHCFSGHPPDTKLYKTMPAVSAPPVYLQIYILQRNAYTKLDRHLCRTTSTALTFWPQLENCVQAVHCSWLRVCGPVEQTLSSVPTHIPRTCSSISMATAFMCFSSLLSCNSKNCSLPIIQIFSHFKNHFILSLYKCFRKTEKCICVHKG